MPTYEELRFEFLKSKEGSRLAPYKDTNGFSTIGIGFNLEAPANRAIFKRVTGRNDIDALIAGKGQITTEEERALFDASVQEAENVVANKFQNVQMSGSQRLALVSLAFNNPSLIGPNLTRFVSRGEVPDAVSEIRFKSNKRRSPGIQKRREAEANMFAGVSGEVPLPVPPNIEGKLFGDGP